MSHKVLNRNLRYEKFLKTRRLRGQIMPFRMAGDEEATLAAVPLPWEAHGRETLLAENFTVSSPRRLQLTLCDWMAAHSTCRSTPSRTTSSR